MAKEVSPEALTAIQSIPQTQVKSLDEDPQLLSPDLHYIAAEELKMLAYDRSRLLGESFSDGSGSKHEGVGQEES